MSKRFKHPSDIEYFIWHSDKCTGKIVNEWDDFADALFAENNASYWGSIDSETQQIALEFGLELLEKYKIKY